MPEIVSVKSQKAVPIPEKNKNTKENPVWVVNISDEICQRDGADTRWNKISGALTDIGTNNLRVD